MNPVGLLVIAIGVLILIIGFKGSQHRVVAAMTNQSVKSS